MVSHSVISPHPRSPGGQLGPTAIPLTGPHKGLLYYHQNSCRALVAAPSRSPVPAQPGGRASGCWGASNVQAGRPVAARTGAWGQRCRLGVKKRGGSAVDLLYLPACKVNSFKIKPTTKKQLEGESGLVCSSRGLRLRAPKVSKRDWARMVWRRASLRFPS